MEYRIERKVSFWEISSIEADSIEDLKEKLKEAKLEWDVDFEFDPTVEKVLVYSEEEEEYEFDKDIMEKDFVEAENGCIIFNREEFDKFHYID